MKSKQTTVGKSPTAAALAMLTLLAMAARISAQTTDSVAPPAATMSATLPAETTQGIAPAPTTFMVAPPAASAPAATQTVASQPASGGAAVATQTAVRPEAQSLSRLPPLASPRPFSKNFSLLASRSIFLKGRMPSFASVVTSRPVGIIPESDLAKASANMLVFNGATVTAEQSWAFIENMGVSRISIVHPGDAIAHGIITRIALDFLEYEADGKVIRVAIGQNLVGQATGDATMPAVSVSTTNPSSGSPGEDILERRRRARLRELGQ